jgi:hypothetical protein
VNKVVWWREGGREEVREGWRKLPDQELHDLYFSPDMAHMGEYSNARFGLGSLRERGRLVDLGVHGSIILKSVIKK